MSFRIPSAMLCLLLMPSMAQAGDKIGNGAPAKIASQSSDVSIITGCASINGKKTCVIPLDSVNYDDLYLHAHIGDICNAGINPHVDAESYVTEGENGHRVKVPSLGWSVGIGYFGDSKTCSNADTCPHTYYGKGCRQSCITAFMKIDGYKTTGTRLCSE